ncbi:hypothetical protein FKW77_006880 [Venturia effusa]|uniref:Mid2 domain-containing protein n=1 Tax=Venturia effusa TaxID=50376 RepID=A0A517LHG4_9PEZI|nr:hypothetical protein FKW77_006880 [Venturia effusa]
MQTSFATYLYLYLATLSLIDAQFPQQCYYAPGKLAGSAIIPCGDPALGVQSCCQNGDFCMSDSVCYNSKTGVTYQYGCTDSSYNNRLACPKKCGLDVEKSNWIGLIYCNASGNQWDCNHPDTCADYCPSNAIWQQAIQSLPTRPRGCDDLHPQKGAFAGPTSLAPIMLLPTNLGGMTSYYSLSANGGSYVTYTATTPYPTTTTSIQTTTASSSTRSGGLTTGAKAGIGAGIGTAVLAIFALAAYLLMKRRKRSKVEQKIVTAPDNAVGEQGTVMDQDHWSTKAELANDAQTQRSPVPPPQELPTNNSGQDLSLRGKGGVESDKSVVHELPDNDTAKYTHVAKDTHAA